MIKRILKRHELDGFTGRVIRADNYIVPNKHNGYIRVIEVVLQDKDDPELHTILRQSTNNDHGIAGENLFLAVVGDTIEITKRNDGLLELEIYSDGF